MDGGLRSWKYSIFAIFAVLPLVSWADSVNSEWYSPLRTLCMGNVAIALSDDPDSSMFYNPAGLAHNRKASVEYFNPLFEIGAGDFSLVHSHALNLSKNGNLGTIRPYLAQSENRPSSLGFSLYPNLQAQNFSFGVAMSARGASYMDPNGNLHYKSSYLVVPTMGFSVGLIGGRWRLGFAVRGVQLAENDKTVTDFSNIGYRVGTQQGFAISSDAGTQFSLPMAGLPTIGVVARNIMSTAYSSSLLTLAPGSVGTPSTATRSYDVGFSVQPRFSRQNVLTLSSDFRDVLDQTKTPTLRHVNLGTEFGVSRTAFLRGGMRDGYWTAGIGVKGKYASLDIGTYADELSDHGWHQVQDRRYAIQFGNRF